MTLLNADLKQIEVVIFAQLCEDPLLLKLLNEGKDLHRYIGSGVYNKPESEITDLERSLTKQSTFGIIYGNGPKTLAERTGQSIEWAKQFIETFYQTFPRAKLWHQHIQDQVNKSGSLKLFTGETLKFKKYPAKFQWQVDQGIVESYNPPDIKNHPVQHIAFVITALLIGRFFREKAIYKRDKYLLINTVHDSLMLDCKPEYIDEAEKDILDVTNSLPELCYTIWKVKLLAPIKIEFSRGMSWLDL